MSAQTSWRPLDVTDSTFTYSVHRVLTGVRQPDLDLARERAQALVAELPILARVVDNDGRRWRPLDPTETRDVAEHAVVATSDCADDPRAAVAHLRALPLDHAPFRLVLGPGWVGFTGAHAVLDGGSTFALLGALLDHAPQVPGRSVGPARRNRMLAGHLARHVAPWRAAWNYRAVTAGPRSAGPDPRGEQPVLTHGQSDDGVIGRLRRIRDDRWPRATLGAVVLVGLRGALTRSGMAPGPGQDVLFDLRRYFPHHPGLLGNWSTGAHVVAAQPDSPQSTSEAMREASDSGLPLAAMAAHRALVRRPQIPTGQPALAEPHGRPRLTYSWFSAHSGARTLPWSGEARDLLRDAPPHGFEAMSIAASELGRRLSVSVSHYDGAWRQTAVTEALNDLFEDPISCLESDLVREGAR